MNDNQGLNITLSQAISVDQLAEVIVGGMYNDEIVDLISLIVTKKMDDDEYYREFANNVVARIS